jgi:hypothetical protein
MSRDTGALFNKMTNGDRIALGQVMTLAESHLWKIAAMPWMSCSAVKEN